MMKKALIGLLVAGTVITGCQKEAEVKTEEDKTFYALGTMFGQRLSSFGLSEKELAIVSKGLKDSAQAKKLAIDPVKYQKNVRELFQSRMKKKSEGVKESGVAYLEKFVKDGAMKTKSGLAYKILKEGTGAKPKATDTVEVHYHGTLIDGTVFDSSVERKKKVSFPLNRVIKGWTEGLQLVGVGGKIRLVIPSSIGYGDNGAPPKIPGGSTLVFDVELFDIKAPAPAKKKKNRKNKKK